MSSKVSSTGPQALAYSLYYCLEHRQEPRSPRRPSVRPSPKQETQTGLRFTLGRMRAEAGEGAAGTGADRGVEASGNVEWEQGTRGFRGRSGEGQESSHFWTLPALSRVFLSSE